jgi:hypothetical protein
MEKSFDRRTFASAMGAIALAACSLEATPQPGAPEAVQHRAYRYDGVAGTSDVTQERAADGRESLRGTTDVKAPAASTGRTVTREAASLDQHGRLRHAEIIIGEGGAASVQYTLDPGRGAVHVERPGAPPIDWRVPNDAPWLYAPSEDGTLIATPVAGWVALRAASASDVVRVLEPEQRRTYLMTVDQVAVATERGTTVALGSDGIDVDAEFISELRLLHGAVTLARITAQDVVPRT